MFLLLVCIAIIFLAVVELEKSVNPSFNIGGSGEIRVIVGAGMVFVLLCYSMVGLLRRFFGKPKKSVVKEPSQPTSVPNGF